MFFALMSGLALAGTAAMTAAEDQHYVCAELREEMLEGTRVDLTMAIGRWSCHTAVDDDLSAWWTRVMVVGEPLPQMRLGEIPPAPPAAAPTPTPPPPAPLQLPPVQPTEKKNHQWVAPVVVGGVVLTLAPLVAWGVFEATKPQKTTVIIEDQRGGGQ